MENLKSLILFQRRIIPWALLFSVPLGLILFKKPWGIGLMLLFLAPILHYYTYEVRSKNEYIFYFNLGFTRFGLWISTFGIGVLSILLLSAI